MANIPLFTSESYRVLALSRQQHGLYKMLSDYLEVIEIDDWTTAQVKLHQPDVLLTASADWYESIACIEQARNQKIPTLLVMDGILEWRNEWENPTYGAGEGVPRNQPILTDKVACLGWRDARVFESWGNIGKCEIVGSPRFDHYLTDPVVRQPHGKPRRLLIMTANTPGFTAEQIALVEQSLQDLKEILGETEAWEPVWRVRGKLDQKLNLTDRFPQFREQPLKTVFGQVDAVISTPSTVLLESMLAKLPTAIVDYTNSPAYICAAWMVTAREHIQPTLAELIQLPQKRMVFQDEILHTALECNTLALPRMVELVQQMARLGKQARESDLPLSFAGRILPVDFNGYALPSEHFDLARLYPDHPVIANADIDALKRDLIFFRQKTKELERELAKMKHKTLLSTALRYLFKRNW